MFNLFKRKTETADPYGISPWSADNSAEFDPVTIDLARQALPEPEIRVSRPKTQPSYAMNDPVYWAG
ncbi:MAG: hypothetical protein Hens3KO_25940 [Henriciella sp.]